MSNLTSTRETRESSETKSVSCTCPKGYDQITSWLPCPVLPASRISAALAAFTFFVGLNILSTWFLPGCLSDRFALQNRDAFWWAAKHYRDLPHHADILLLGSSLMCRVVNEGDATFLKHPVNALAHYRSEHLENALSAQGRYRTASLAVGGMNVSDVAVLVPELCQSGKKPSVIVYGIGPRDLFDNSLESPSDTPAFRLAEKLADFDDEVEKMARPGRGPQFKLAVNRCLRYFLPIYCYQGELAVIFRRVVKKGFDLVLDAAFPRPEKLVIEQNSVQQMVLHLVPIDLKNYCLVKPDNPLRPERFDFTNNYIMSYNPFKPALYQRQLFFLRRFLNYCKRERITTILVKMPLRKDNFALMPPNFYDLYSQDVDGLAREYKAVVIDPSATVPFTDDDFTDTVHLTGRGACRLIELIAPTIARYLPTQQ